MKYRYWILTAIALFGMGVVLGLITPVDSVLFPSEDLAAMSEFGELLQTFPAPLMAMFIFFKNSLALLVSFALSPIFCLVPIAALIVNGWLLSFVSSLVVKEESLGFVLAALIPHGIVEFPAFIIGEAAALSFGAVLILAMFRGGNRGQILSSLKRNLRYLVMAFALLVPAAIIEAFVTPLLLT